MNVIHKRIAFLESTNPSLVGSRIELTRHAQAALLPGPGHYLIVGGEESVALLLGFTLGLKRRGIR